MGDPVLSKIAELALKRSQLLLVLATVVVVAMGALGAGAFGKLLGGGFDDPDAQSSRAAVRIDEKFGGETNLLFLIGSEGRGRAPRRRRAGPLHHRRPQGRHHREQRRLVLGHQSPRLISENGGEALIALHVKGDETERGERAEQLIDRYTGERDGVEVRAGGESAVNIDVSSQVSGDLAVAEAIAVPVTLLLLVLAFGSLVAAMLPLVIGLIAIVGTFALLFVLGSVSEVSVFAINLTTALGLGLGIDYALLLVSRFREQLTAGEEVPEALRTTVRTAGRTILSRPRPSPPRSPRCSSSRRSSCGPSPTRGSVWS